MATIQYALRKSLWSKLFIGIVILFFFAYIIAVNWNQLQQYDWRIHPIYIGLAFFCYPINLGLSIINWHLLIVGTGGQVNFRDNAEIFCFSNFSKNVPGSIWYVMSRTYMYRERGVDHAKVILASASELLLLVFAGAIACIMIIPFAVQITISSYMWWLLPTIMCPLLIAPIFNKVLDFLQARIGKTQRVYFSQRIIIIIIINYIMAWIWGGLILFLLSNSVVSIPINNLCNIVFVWIVSGIASLSTAFVVNGMGVKEATLSLLLSDYMLLPVAVVVSILFKLLIIISDLFWSGVIVFILIFWRE